MRCAAILVTQFRHKQPWVKCCENSAVMKFDGVPLCGTHINHPPKMVAIEPVFGFGTTEPIP